MHKSNTNKKNQEAMLELLNEDLEFATKVSKARNYHKLNLKDYLNQEEKNEDENTKTKT